MANQRFHLKFEATLGQYADGIKAKINEFGMRGVPKRIWSKDASLWLYDETTPARAKEIVNRLGWLDLPLRMQAQIEEIKKKTDELRQQGFRHIVLLGMGGSSLAAQVFASLANNNELGDPRIDFRLIDTTHPTEIAQIESSIDLKRTLFIVASKSGTTQETICLLTYFFEKISKLSSKPGDHFIAITDPHTPLHQSAESHGFKHIFLAPSDVGGRYSALSHFGLVPASLMGIDIAGLISQARRAAEACSSYLDSCENPALIIAAAIAQLYEQGIDKLALIAEGPISIFADWLEQLIAESTGKQGKGILPVINEPWIDGLRYSQPRLLVKIDINSTEAGNNRLDQMLKEAADQQCPIFRIKISHPLEIAAHMFIWEFAIAAVCSEIGVNAFDEPDVKLAKDLARKAIQSKIRPDGDQEPFIVCKTIDQLANQVDNLLADTKPQDYFAIQAFLPRSGDLVRDFQSLRLSVVKKYGIATTLGFGPRFLHSTGQLHKGGPSTGHFLQVLDRPSVDMAIPQTDISFAELITAQAMGDYLALRERGRRIIRARLDR